jgi:hypothetical protein
MSPFKAKQKGSTFERDAVNLLNDKIKNAKFRRIPGSGAIGTSMMEPLLTGDISGIVEGFPKVFKIEAKVGYNNSTNKEVKQFTLKKEWIDKIRMQAENNFSFPALIGKFTGARSGVSTFIVLDIDDFAYLINQITFLQETLSENLDIDVGDKNARD